MPTSVSIHLDEAAIDDLLDDDAVEDLALEVGERVADEMAAGAPKDTGAGAASIEATAEHDGDGVVVGVGWDHEHDYLWFIEDGTEYIDPRPFARPAADAAHL